MPVKINQSQPEKSRQRSRRAKVPTHVTACSSGLRILSPRKAGLVIAGRQKLVLGGSIASKASLRDFPGGCGGGHK
jgi:hypothetical protein